MKHLVLLMIIIMLALVSCMPTTDTTNTPLEESSDPLNSVTPEATTGSDIEEQDSELLPATEPVQTIPQESDEDIMKPTTMEEKPTMTPSNTEVSNPDQLPQVQMAKEDLANRLNISTDHIEIISVELVTWPNSGMGCPQPGMEYKQVPVDGLLIRLSVDGVEYNYHSGGSRDPFLCQPSPTAKSTPLGLNIEDFITPPSGNIDE